MKKLLSIILTISLLTALTPALTLTAGADDFGDGWTLINNVLTIESDTGMLHWVRSGRSQVGRPAREEITSVTIEDGVTYISDYAFSEFSKLTSVSIPEGVTSIGDAAFLSCVALQHLIIPASVTTIGHYAFYGGSDSTFPDVTFKSATPPEFIVDHRHRTFSLGAIIKVPKGAYGAYRALEALDPFYIDDCEGACDCPTFEGEGTETSPWLIDSGHSLAVLAKLVNTGNSYTGKYFKLTRDINLSNVCPGNNWVPIGEDVQYFPFQGHFDGGEHVIKNLEIFTTSTSNNYKGLFGGISNGSVKNLGLENVNIQGYNYVGGIAGTIDLTNITNCYVTGTIRGNGMYGYVGGIVGSVDGSNSQHKIENCYVTADVSGPVEPIRYIGGIAGYIKGNLKILNSYATGKISGFNNVGGIVGFIDGNFVDSIIHDSAALNPSVSTTNIPSPAVGRVFGGDTTNKTATVHNVAFNGMMVNGTTVEDTSRNGTAWSSTEILADATMGGRFKSDGGPWTIEPNKLPGLFGKAVDLPAHIFRIDSIEINAPSEFEKGLSYRLSATAYGINPPQEFDWSLDTNYATGTQINPETGELVIAPDETATEITINARSIYGHLGQITCSLINPVIGTGWLFYGGTLIVSSNEGTNGWRNSTAFEFADVKKLIIQDNVTNIRQNAFFDCVNLTSVTIPENVDYIEPLAFSRTGLTAITFKRAQPPGSEPTGNYLSNVPDELAVFVPVGAGELYESDRNLSSFKIEEIMAQGEDYVLGDGGTLFIESDYGMADWIKSGRDVPENIAAVTRVILHETVTQIGNSAFANCVNLETINFQNPQLPVFGVNVFSGVSQGGTAHIPQGSREAYGDIPQLTEKFTLMCPLAQGVMWALYDDGLLIIRNSTGMQNWNTHRGGNETSRLAVKTAVIRIVGGTLQSNLFQNCVNLTSVSIPEGITEIGSNAFSGCTSLTNVQLPTSLTIIGTNAFMGCTQLTSIELPENLQFIRNGAFNNSGLVSITIPESVTDIGVLSSNGSALNAFASTNSLTSMTFKGEQPPSGVVGIGASTSRVRIFVPHGASAAYRSNAGFSGTNNYNIHEIDEQGEGWFIDTNGLLVIRTVAGMNDWAANTTHRGLVKNILLENAVTSIADNAFADCVNLTSVSLPNHVTTIGDNAFENCTALTSVTLGTGITAIGSEAFKDCENLAFIQFNRPSPPSFGSNVFDGVPQSATIYVPTGAKQDYSDAGGNNFTGRYLTEVRARGTDWLLDTDGLLTISSNTGMANWLNSGKTANDTFVEHAIIESGVTSIGDQFKNLENMKTIEIPEGVTSIGPSAFEGCSSLESIRIPDSVTNISFFYTFVGCTSLQSVHFGAGIESIYSLNTIFINCTALTEITVSAENPNYTAIDGVLFNKDATTLVFMPTWKTGHYKISDTVTSLTASSFFRTRLTTIELPNNPEFTTIPEEAFRNSALTHVTIPDSVQTIGQGAFSTSSGLTSVEFGSGVTNIGNGALVIPGLTSATFKTQTPPTFGHFIFGTPQPEELVIYVPFGAGERYKAETALNGIEIVEYGGYVVNFSAVDELNGSITATSSSGTLSSGDKVAENEPVTFTATPEEGYRVKEWRHNTEIVNGTELTYSTQITEDITIVTVEFEPIPEYAVNFSVVDELNGTLTASSSSGRRYSSGEKIRENETVIFAATPNDGYRVKEWRNNGVIVANNKTNSYQTTITRETTVTVEFEDVSAPVYKIGDCNNDGVINIADLTYLKWAIVRNNPEVFPINDQCKVAGEEASDALNLSTLRNYLAGVIREFPES
ncbi:MAG: leucine-rich repeat protein [Oscillospiraceae bacterium]|nr:leucine-rich repeat protein [Oscillospiraceae bacterium]